MRKMSNYNYNVQVITASVRGPMHIVRAGMIGAHICTVPPEVIEKLFYHPLTDIGLEKFLIDWEKLTAKLRQ